MTWHTTGGTGTIAGRCGMDGTATLRNDVVVVVVLVLWVALSSGLLFHRGNMLIFL